MEQFTFCRLAARGDSHWELSCGNSAKCLLNPTVAKIVVYYDFFIKIEQMVVGEYKW
jgi:hypothetical protein